MDEEVERHSSDEEPFSALAFKIMTDPFVGKLSILQSLLWNNARSGSYVLTLLKVREKE